MIVNQSMANALEWQEEDVDCDWILFFNGYAYGFAYLYGRNNNPYTAIKRESDGLMACVPTDEGSDFSTSDWTTNFQFG